MASNNNNNNNSRRKKHPLEKSLAIFPLVPRIKSLVSNPFSSSLLSCSSPAAPSRRKRYDGASHSATTNFNRTNYNTSNQSFSAIERHPLIDDNNYHSTKRKLNHASKYLPKKQGGPLTFKLPPILSSRQSSLIIHQNESSKDTFPKLNPCTCGRKRNHQHKSRLHEQPSLKDQLVDLKYKELAQTYRPDETPRLLSINVRWKTRRDGVSEFNRQTLIETFTPFGEITNVVFTSGNNAVVVFSTADSACTATKVFMKIGREMRLNVKWLNDMNQRN